MIVKEIESGKKLRRSYKLAKFRDFELLLFTYLGQQGYLSRNIFYYYIGKKFYKSKKSFDRRILKLKKEGWIDECPNIIPTEVSNTGLMYITQKTIDKLEFYYPYTLDPFYDKYNFLSINPSEYEVLGQEPSQTTTKHDYKLSGVRFELEKYGLKEWKSSNLLRYYKSSLRYKGYRYSGEHKADATFKTKLEGDRDFIELELTKKNPKRIEEILKFFFAENYHRNRRVFYIFGDSKVKNWFVKTVFRKKWFKEIHTTYYETVFYTTLANVLNANSKTNISFKAARKSKYRNYDRLNLANII